MPCRADWLRAAPDDARCPLARGMPGAGPYKLLLADAGMRTGCGGYFLGLDVLIPQPMR